MFLRRWVGVSSGILALAACSSPSADWSEATTENAPAAYGSFLARFPNDAHVGDAERKIAELKDASDWKRAQVASSIGGYQQYLRAGPGGAHVQVARENVILRERADAWAALQSNMTTSALKTFLNSFSSGPEVDEARAKLQILTGYRAVVATAVDRRVAAHKRDRLAQRFDRTLDEVVVLPPDSQNPAYRVASSPMSEQQAKTICDSLARGGRECQVVPNDSNSSG